MGSYINDTDSNFQVYFALLYIHSPEFAGERIPTLHETLDLCEELDLVLFLELKGGSTDQVMNF